MQNEVDNHLARRAMGNEIEYLLSRQEARSLAATTRLDLWLLIAAGFACGLFTLLVLLAAAATLAESGPLAHLNRLSILSAYLSGIVGAAAVLVLGVAIRAIGQVLGKLSSRAIFLVLSRPEDSLSYLRLADTPDSEFFSTVRRYGSIVWSGAAVFLFALMVKAGPATAITSLEQVTAVFAVLVLIPSYYFVLRFARFSPSPHHTLKTLFSYPAILNSGSHVLIAALMLGVVFPESLTRAIFPFCHWWMKQQSHRLEEAVREVPAEWRVYAAKTRDSFLTLEATLPGTADRPLPATVACGQLNVRSEPGTEHPAVGRLQAGEKLLLLERRDGWGRVDTGTAQGWISLRFVTPAAVAEDPFGKAAVLTSRRIACELGVLGLILLVAVPAALRIVGISFIKALGLSLAGVVLEEAARASLSRLLPEHDWRGELGLFLGVLISTALGLLATRDCDTRVEAPST